MPLAFLSIACVPILDPVTRDRREAGCIADPALRARARNDEGAEGLRELVRTNDAVLLSAIEALLSSARIAHMIVDQNMSVLEGSIGIFPRRILVGEDEFAAARRLLADAGYAKELRPEV